MQLCSLHIRSVCVVLFIFEAILARHQTSDFLRRLFIYSYWSLTCSYVCSTLVEGGMYIGGIWPANTRRMGKMFLWLLFVLNALNWIPLAMLYLYCMCKKEFWMRARNVWGFLVSAPSTRFLVRGKICVLHRHHHRIIWILLHTILTGMRKKLMLTSHQSWHWPPLWGDLAIIRLRDPTSRWSYSPFGDVINTGEHQRSLHCGLGPNAP